MTIEQTIYEIADAINLGHHIDNISRPNTFKWIWHDTTNDCKWTISIMDLKYYLTIADERIADIVCEFIKQKVSAIEAQTKFEKLQKLKAFW